MYLEQKLEINNRACKNWLVKVRDLLYSLGLNYYWDQQDNINVDSFLSDYNVIKSRIRDQYIQSFFTDKNLNNRLEKYKVFKC